MNRCLSNEKNTFADYSRVYPTIFLMEKQSVSLKLLTGDFYGQSVIKTVRGPLYPPPKLCIRILATKEQLLLSFAGFTDKTAIHAKNIEMYAIQGQ